MSKKPKPETDRKPKKVITRGSLTVKIYERTQQKQIKEGKRDYTEYTLIYYNQEGVRKRETSSDFESLCARADEVLDDLSEGRTQRSGMTVGQRNECERALRIAEPTGLPLDVLARHSAEAIRIMGGDFLIPAARDYATRQMNRVQPKLISEAVSEFLEEKERQKRSDAHRNRLKIHLERFAGRVVDSIASVTGPQIDLFLDSLKAGDPPKPVGSRTRDNYADSIVALYRWAKRKRYVPGDFDEMERITRYDPDEDGEIEIYTPSEMSALLSVAEDELIPFLAIGGFAGLRSSEILRLSWEDVRTENGDPCIVVQKGKVKKRGKSRRIVPIAENLKRWLTPIAKKAGPVWEWSEPLLYKRVQELALKAEALLKRTDRDAKLEWRPNALRHSFISHYVMRIKDVPQVALEAGNSPQIIDSNYRELVGEEEAQQWFKITPIRS